MEMAHKLGKEQGLSLCLAVLLSVFYCGCSKSNQIPVKKSTITIGVEWTLISTEELPRNYCHSAFLIEIPAGYKDKNFILEDSLKNILQVQLMLISKDKVKVLKSFSYRSGKYIGFIIDGGPYYTVLMKSNIQFKTESIIYEQYNEGI
jgi:hypothetical protein